MLDKAAEGREFLLAHSLSEQVLMLGRSWQQEHRQLVTVVSTVRKQLEAKAGSRVTFLFLIQSRTPARGIMPFMFTVGLLYSIQPF